MESGAIDKLSEMQRACLRLVAELKKTEQIAGDLGISPSTVNTHIERAMARLQVTTRREAARLVVAHDVMSHRAVAPPPGFHSPAIVSSTPAVVDEAALTPCSMAIEADADEIVAAVMPGLPASTTTGIVVPRRREKHPTEGMPLTFTPAPPPNEGLSTTAIGRRRNDLTIPQRLGLAGLALVLLCIAIAGLGAAIEQLSTWRASLAGHP